MKSSPVKRRSGAGYTTGIRTVKPNHPDARWATSNQVCIRYARSQQWLWNQEKYNPNFPKPAYEGRRRLYSVPELEAYDRKLLLKRAEAQASKPPQAEAHDQS